MGATYSSIDSKSLTLFSKFYKFYKFYKNVKAAIVILQIRLSSWVDANNSPHRCPLPKRWHKRVLVTGWMYNMHTE